MVFCVGLSLCIVNQLPAHSLGKTWCDINLTACYSLAIDRAENEWLRIILDNNSVHCDDINHGPNKERRYLYTS